MSNDNSDTDTDDVDGVDELAGSKTIILFSDGTGNHSGKLQKTNVWRMYQAVDLGVPRQRNHPVQIGRYDNGVANSTFRLFAMLQGIFGWGLKRNILSLYLFLCKNYRTGDRICLFGFSRGAFTVRVIADLIDKQGVIPHDRAGALDYLVRDAYRSYRKRARPRMWPMRWLIPLVKWICAGLRAATRIALRRQRYNPGTNHRPRIAFLGVWDTVGAYGGPILEVVRAVDDWIMPISFRDTRLPDCVDTARHALALDDERDSFQPLPWNETGESRQRLQQVWFAGMHSDVGGGYPDDSLSYVSFVWMLEEARERARIRFRGDRENEARLQADSFGPIHDSRAGLAGYYRYQPRKISALLWPRVKGSESMVDPEQAEGQGLRRPALIHDSVFRRILSGTDGYAPIPISKDFEIVEDLHANLNLRLPAEHHERLSDRQWQRLHEAAQENVADIVWWRRIIYFLIVLTSLGLAASPLLIRWIGYHAIGAAADLIRVPLALVDGLNLPMLGWWLDAFIACPWIPLILAILIFGLFRASGMLEKLLRTTSRSNWFAPMRKPRSRTPRKSWVYRFRTHWAYQDVLGFVRWQFLPFVFGIAMLVLVFTAAVSLATIARLTWSEQDDVFCPRGPWPETGRQGAFWMSTDNPCNRSPVAVARGRRYVVTLVVPPGRDWRDGGSSATPEGIRAGELMPLQFDRLLSSMRRRPDANWMQPLAHIIPGPGRLGATRTQILDMNCDRAGRVCVAAFTAERSGLVSLAVNEAIPPWPFAADFFYRGRVLPLGDGWIPLNQGGACVWIAALRRDGVPAPPQPAPACSPPAARTPG